MEWRYGTEVKSLVDEGYLKAEIVGLDLRHF